MSENLAGLFPTHRGFAVGYKRWTWTFTRKIVKEGDEGLIWFLLTAYSKIREEGDKLRKKLLSKKEPELDWGDSKPIQIAEDTVVKACSGERIKGVAG